MNDEDYYEIVEVTKTVADTHNNETAGNGKKGKGKRGKGKAKGGGAEEKMVEVPKLRVGSTLPEFAVARLDQYGNYVGAASSERLKATVKLQCDGNGMVCELTKANAKTNGKKGASSSTGAVVMGYQYDMRDNKREAQVRW